MDFFKRFKDNNKDEEIKLSPNVRRKEKESEQIEK
jgi:hypothetical protein